MSIHREASSTVVRLANTCMETRLKCFAECRVHRSVSVYYYMLTDYLQIEISTGKFPYSQWQTPFEQLRQVVQDDPPKLPNDKFSHEFVHFVDSW